MNRTIVHKFTYHWPESKQSSSGYILRSSDKTFGGGPTGLLSIYIKKPRNKAKTKKTEKGKNLEQDLEENYKVKRANHERPLDPNPPSPQCFPLSSLPIYFKSFQQQPHI